MKKIARRFAPLLLAGCALALTGCETAPETRTYIAPMAGARQTHTAQQAEVICSARAQGAGSQAAAAEAARQQSQNNFGSTISGNCVRVGNIVNCSGQQTQNSGGPLVGFLQGAMQGLEDSAASNSAYTACLAEMGFESRTVAVSSSGSATQGIRTDAPFRYNSGLAEYKAGRYRQAFGWFELASHDNFSPALHALGTMYGRGEGVDKDSRKALSYIRRAADLGYQPSKDFISRAGNMVAAPAAPPAPSSASQPPSDGRHEIFSKANAGDANAQLQLGRVYLVGNDVWAPDRNVAIYWFKRSAAGGNSEARAELKRLSVSD